MRPPPTPPTSSSPPSLPADLILRVSLVIPRSDCEEDDDSYREEDYDNDDEDGCHYKQLSPPVWRRIKVSSALKLSVMHDKVLAPVMGWTRNYHGYVYEEATDGARADFVAVSRTVHDDEDSWDVSEFSALAVTEKDSVNRGGRSGWWPFGSSSKEEPMAVPSDDGGGDDEIEDYADDGDLAETPPSSRSQKANRMWCPTEESNYVDMMHAEDSWVGPDPLDPAKTTLGEVLKREGDRMLYTYDLGDQWRHLLEVERVLSHTESGTGVEGQADPVLKADGKCVVLDGAMRCPDEDGKGCCTYQDEVLDPWNLSIGDPHDDVLAREAADACFSRHNALNVRGRFDPAEFTVEDAQRALEEALRSRSSVPGGPKQFTNLQFGGISPFATCGPGQRVVTTQVEDDRGGEGFHFTFTETVNVKPDGIGSAVCCCGNPTNLKLCSRCKAAWYCSVECQKRDYSTHHKKVCKQERKNVQAYQVEMMAGKRPPPDICQIKGPTIPLNRTKGPLRFKVGDCVECRMSADMYRKGQIVKTWYREDDWPGDKPSAPYQIALDDSGRYGGDLIYANWDDDSLVRKLPTTPVVKQRIMEIVD